MKNVILSVIAIVFFSVANAQEIKKSAITEMDRQHLEVAFPLNPDYVWNLSTIKIIDSFPKELYKTSFIEGKILAWKNASPRIGDTVMVYDNIAFKKHQSTTYYLLAQPSGQSEQTQIAKSSQKRAKKAPKPQGNGQGFEKVASTAVRVGSVASAILGGGRFGGGLLGGSDLGLGGNTRVTNIVGYQNQ